MLEGLDITVLKLSEVRTDNEKFRVDDGYFAKLPVLTQHRVEALPHLRLGAVCSVFRKGIFDIKASSYAESVVPFVRIGDLHDGLIDTKGLAFITPAAHAAESKTALSFGDLVLSKTGYAAASFVNLPECNVSQDTIAVRLSPDGRKQLKSGYLVAYLNSRYGIALMDRHFQGNVQLHLSLPDGRKVPVPIFSKALQETTDKGIRNAHEQFHAAKLLMEKAADVLTAALGFANWKPPEPLTYAHRASGVLAARRFDAEFFDPGKTIIVDRLLGYGARPLGDLVEVETGFPWDSDLFLEDRTPAGEPFVRIRDCKLGTLDPVDLDKLVSSYAEPQGQPRAKAGDLVVGMDGLRWFYTSLLTGPCYINQRVAHLRVPAVSSLSSEFLLICLNSILGQQQFLRVMTIAHTVGHITLNDIRRVLIPTVQKATHDDITSKVREAHAARKRAHKLLEQAKRAVEIAIEDSEAAALKYLKDS